VNPDDQKVFQLLLLAKLSIPIFYRLDYYGIFAGILIIHS